MQKLSLGMQEFSEIIKEKSLYVDKTKTIYNLLIEGKAYFLSRPRRFGKSLLVNTIKEIFLGNKELFKNTWIYDKIEWNKRPVIKLDFSGMPYRESGLKESLTKKIRSIAQEYGITLTGSNYAEDFSELITSLSVQYTPPAILIDEYDKPISDYIDDIPQATEHREILKTLYSSLKSLDSHIKFLFITGVTKFSKVSIFSDLNHLEDLTLRNDFADIVGYTYKEIKHYFPDYLEAVKKEYELSDTELFEKMQKKYNGYSWDGKTFLYNPFSLQSFLKSRQFDNFWFATGTATFLVKALKKQGKLPDEISPIIVTSVFFDKFEVENMDLVVLLFQTGYLTIKKIDREYGEYTLAFPNMEVENAFMNNLLETWTNKTQGDLGSITLTIIKSVAEGAPQQFIDAFKSLFSGIPYDDFIKEHAIEAIFRSNVYTALKILGVRQQVEVHTNSGRIDAVLEDKKTIFICEFKMGSSGTAQEAMNQIHEKKYYEPFMTSGKQIFLLGISFDEKKRNIGEYLIEILGK